MSTAKPVVKLTGTDGNIFAVMGLCAKALKEAGQREQAAKLVAEVIASGSYDKAIQTCMKFVQVR